VVLASAAGRDVVAHHVDHGLRPTSADEAAHAADIAATLGVAFELHVAHVVPGPNVEARARAARAGVLPAGTATGHTADDQAETVLLRLLRGTGPDGLAAMAPGPLHPLLALRRAETRGLCAAMGLAVVHDPSNHDPSHRRNRVRHEVLPLLDDVAARDTVPLLVRAADLARDDRILLEELAGALDPTDARALSTAPRSLARRAVRRWLSDAGYPPDAAAIERVLAVAAGHHVACELAPGRRVVRRSQRLRVVEPGR
jgi:tRNA(Ile)-lysidine synthase